LEVIDTLCTPFFTAIRRQRLKTEVPVIALEGQSYAGKSTALAALRDQGYGAIREYSEYKRSTSPDHFVQQSPEEARNDFFFYLDIERLRYQEYLQIESKKPAVFLDRSVFTLIAYRCAILHLSEAPLTGIVPWAMETVVSGAFPILYPRHIIYLHLPLAELKRRHQLAGDHLPSYFMDDVFYTTFFSFFCALQAVEPTWITIIDATQDWQSIFQQIQEVTWQIS
jgi:thymidylate kinase